MAPYPNGYARATENRLDPRDSRSDKTPQLYTTMTGIGASHAFVWMSRSDLRLARFVRTPYALSPQGRRIPDPDNPTAFRFATGPDGEPMFAGVRVRLRVFEGRGRKRFYGPWLGTDAFDVDNQAKPSMTIDALAESPDAPTTILVNWTIFHPDSEDWNADGMLEVGAGEDLNGNGRLDAMPCAVAFDWHFLGPGEDPSTMSRNQLEALWWKPCIRAAGVGDTDSVEMRPWETPPISGDLAGVASAPAPYGRRWVFAWDSNAQFGKTFATDGFILRATPTDFRGNQGATVYSTVVLHPGW
jgi:hypothetical protein